MMCLPNHGFRTIANLPPRLPNQTPASSQLMQSITRSHVESFNFMVEEALPASVQNMRPLEFEVNGRRLKIHIDDVQVGGVRAAGRPSTVHKIQIPLPTFSIILRSNTTCRLACQWLASAR